MTSPRDTWAEPPTAALNHRNKPHQHHQPPSNWEDTEFEPIEESAGGAAGSKLEEARKKREERKLQRQKELEARRANKSGPMKLGAKKV